jgi:hypothetical protein
MFRATGGRSGLLFFIFETTSIGHEIVFFYLTTKTTKDTTIMPLFPFVSLVVFVVKNTEPYR